MKRNILIIGLLLILLIAASLGTTLGLYFLQIGLVGSNVVTEPKKLPRVTLDTVLKNQALGKIENNTSITILNAIKAKNPHLKTEDVFIKDILETKARVYVKSASIYYVDNSYVDVYFYPDRLTINTHLSNLVLWEKVDQLTYVDNDILTVYYNTSGKKLLSDDLLNVNLGKIENKTPTIILAAIKPKNPNVDIDEITVDSNSINSRQATIIVKTESLKYIATSSVIVNYALLNMQVGKIKNILFRNETGWGSSGLDFSVENKITQLDNGEIVLPSYGGILTQIDLESKALNRKSLRFYATAVLKLPNNVFWGQHLDTIYRYEYKWGDWEQQEPIFDNPSNNISDYSTLTLLQDGTVLATWGKNMFHLSSAGEKLGTIVENYFDGEIENVIQLQNGKIWAQTNETIYEIDLSAKRVIQIFNIKSNPWLGGTRRMSAMASLQDGTVLVAGVFLTGDEKSKYDMYVLSNQGSLQNYFTYDKPFIEDSNITSMIQLQDETVLALATGENWKIYQLNTE